MGAWGYKVLQNDMALDLMGTLSKLSPNNSESHGVVETYLQGAKYTEELLLVAEIVDIALNGVDEKILGSTYGYDEWFNVIHKNGRFFKPMVDMAVKAVRSIDVKKEGWFNPSDAANRTKLLKKIERRLSGEITEEKKTIKRVYREMKSWTFEEKDILTVNIGDKVRVKLDLEKNLKSGRITDLKEWGYLDDDGYIDIHVKGLSKGYLFGLPMKEDYNGTGIAIELYPRCILSIRKLQDCNEVLMKANSIKYTEYKGWTVTNPNKTTGEFTVGDKVVVNFDFQENAVSLDFLQEHPNGTVELEIVSVMNKKIKGHVLDCKDPCTYLELYPKNILNIQKL